MANASKTAQQPGRVNNGVSKKVVRQAATVTGRVRAVPGARHINDQLSGFLIFLREQAVVGLAIGIVIGGQIQVIAKALISDFINPLIALLMPGGGDLASKVFDVHHAGRPPQKFLWGDFVSNLIAFVMIVAVIYFVIKGLNLDKLDKKKDTAK